MEFGSGVLKRYRTFSKTLLYKNYRTNFNAIRNF